MGFLKKKKPMQSPSQGGKKFGITISPAHTLSSVFARSPSSATIDDARNDVGSDMRSGSNHSHSIADGITTASKAAVKHINSNNNNNITTITTHNITVASPLSMASGGGAGKDLRDKPPTAAVATANASNSSAPAIVVMPALIVPPGLPATTTKKQTIDGTDTKPPNKSSQQKIQSSKKTGITSKIVKVPRPRGILSEVVTSYSTCDDDDERESYSDDDDEEEEDDDDDRFEESEERSATYTDDSSNSFVSLGYRTSHSKSSTSFGISHTTSSENTDSTSTTEEEEEEREVKGSRDLTNRERRESMRFVSETDFATSMSSFEVDAPKRVNGKCGTHKAKKCLKKLSTLAAKAKNESNDAARSSAKKLDGLHASRTTTTTGKEKSVIRTFKPPKKDTIACDSVASTDANSSRASTSTAMFMKTMEEYTVKNAENQLLLRVNEHGNVQKMLFQVRVLLLTRTLIICIRIQ
jgi:hypothetical protein